MGDVAGGTPDFVDRLGHGTAVAAAIRERAPAARLYAVKIFDVRLAAPLDRLVAGIDWATTSGAQIVNLSLGTTRAEHAARLQAAVRRAAARGCVVVAADAPGAAPWLPGALDGVIPVGLDWTCPRDGYRVTRDARRARFVATGYARPIPGVPVERNLKGISFAVAAMTGFVARLLEAHPGASVVDIVTRLEADARAVAVYSRSWEGTGTDRARDGQICPRGDRDPTSV